MPEKAIGPGPRKNNGSKKRPEKVAAPGGKQTGTRAARPTSGRSGSDSNASSATRG